MRNYEVGIIVHPEVNPDALNTLVEKIKAWIAESGGSVTKIDQWGKRRLAYVIRKQQDGQYLFIYADMPANATATLERNLRFAEQILRFAIVRPEN
jgi:small subunit ribosomal protein S6